MGNRPLTLRCYRCKRHEDYRGHRTSHERLEATGRLRFVAAYHGRHRVALYQIRHYCGHVMWSNHNDAERLYNLKLSEQNATL